ncbi:Conserved_hypothetical protein [Hexamita inflata]|uniref:Myb-like domain-containing protein n=1 Tax=Hexamita inflata TaxID=28002 RepID=A0AA86QHZ6_9EUKA|nr:Conserved hypothetical protein [Hexamita inflata]
MNATNTVMRKTWTSLEKERFVQLYKIHRINFDLYIPHFENRTLSQIKSFYYNQKYNNRQLENQKQRNDEFQNSLLKAYSQSFDSVSHIAGNQTDDTMHYFCDL